MELSLESRAPRLSTLPAFSAETVFVRSPPRAHAEAIARLRAVVRTCGRAGSGNLRSTCLIYRSSRSSQLSPRPGWYCLAAERTDFAFETTFSGLTYVRRLQAWKQAGYRIEMVYLRLRSVQLALRRIAARVRQGGHDVPRADVVRRFSRGWENFQRIYRPLADSWAVYDNSGRAPRLLEKSP